MKRLPFLLGILFLSLSLMNAQSLTLPALFSDHMVLQQKSSAAWWGTAAPGASVAIVSSWGSKASATADNNGVWTTNLKIPAAGGPFTVTVTSGTMSVTLNDVYAGEVWLCSGQSNMEMPMRGFSAKDSIDGATVDIQNASYPTLRMFTVERTISTEPKSDCKGTWIASSPATAGAFSATAFHFGVSLLKELKVPIGLIHASWGGTPAQAWTSVPFISTVPQFANTAAQLKVVGKENDALLGWLSTLPVIDIAKNRAAADWRGLWFGDSSWMKPSHPDKEWGTAMLPKGWEATEVGAFDGVIWYRKQIALPSSLRGKELVMELGPIDDVDEAYVNGTLVGATMTGSPYNVPRVYTVPASLTADSLMTIAVRVIDFGGGGGFWGSPEQMHLRPSNGGEQFSIAGAWKYRMVAEIRGNSAYLISGAMQRPHITAPFEAHQASSLYNGMIAPLVPYSITGAIWYQGESNTQDPEAYDTLFPLMIRNWRSDWKQEFPFYFVQIAPYEYGPNVRSERLRESQLRALAVPKTGMAVTLDIGDTANIHPANKKDVGDRLARWALAKQYKKKIEYSGPVLKSAAVKKDAMVLTFDHAEGLALRPSPGRNEFLIAGKDGMYHAADVTVKGKTLIVRSPEVPQPASVRYAWSNTATASLFNGAGLPASSFRTDMGK